MLKASSIVKASKRGLVGGYQRQLDKHPLLVRMGTSFTIFSIGDLLGQAAERRIKSANQQKEQESGTQAENKWDRQRTLRQGFIGGAILSPSLHLFFSRFMNKLAYRGISGILAKATIHQACVMPLMQFSLLFLAAALAPADSLSQRYQNGRTRFNEKWVAGCTASMLFWPPVNILMYARVPLPYYSIYKDCMVLLFASTMSYIANNNITLSPVTLQQSLKDASKPQRVRTRLVLSVDETVTCGKNVDIPWILRTF